MDDLITKAASTQADYVKSSDQIIDNASLRDAHSSFIFSLYMATRETDKPLLLSAILGSKDEVAMM